MRGRWFFIRESSGMKWLIVAAKEHRRIGNFYLSPPPPSYRRKEQNQMCANRIGQFTYLLTARSIWYLDCWWSFGNFFFVMVFVHVDGIDHLTRVWSSRGIQPQFEVFHRFSSPFRKILSVPECLRSWCEYNNFVYTERSNGKIMKLRWNVVIEGV